jgi:predicted RND superfamily exporter protein
MCMALTYGVMAAIGVRLDVGTSMLGAIAAGASVDFSIHLLWALRAKHDGGLARALQDRAPGIWVNAWMVSGGFLVLTLGESRPLQNVGSLTAIAVLSSAVATFSLVPWLTRRGLGTTATEAP